MKKQLLLPIQKSLGFALRGMRARKDYLNHLVHEEKTNVLATVVGHPIFKDAAIETFSRTGAKIHFIDYLFEDDSLKNFIDYFVASRAKDLGQIDIIWEFEAVQRLKQLYGDKYHTIFDELNYLHPYPKGPSVFVKDEVVKENEERLKSAINNISSMMNCIDKKIIFLPFSGIKAFGTEYGDTSDEEDKIKQFMSFPFEDSIPAICKIQNNLARKNIIVIPVIIQYGSLHEIHEVVSSISRKHKLRPAPTSLDIDWNNDLKSQIGFFHALNQWSRNSKLPNLAIVHGSLCLHLIEECVDPKSMIAFFATHTERLKPRDDGRKYHVAVAEGSSDFLQVVQPPTMNSHDYKLVANQIIEKVNHVFF